MIRLGILGCGRIAQLIHIKQFARLAGVEIVALADERTDNLAAALAMVPTAQPFEDWQDLIAAQVTDAVVITLPPTMHADAALAAMAAGNHIYLEKPLALSVEDGARIVAAQATCGKVAQIGLNFRYHPNYLDLRRQVTEGLLGEIIAVRTVFCSARRVVPDWKSTRDTGGSVLRDLGTHHLDLIEFVLGDDIVSLGAVERSIDYEGDCATVIGTTRSGVSIDLLLSLSGGVATNRVEILGTAGHLVADTSDARPRRAEGKMAGSARIAKLRRAVERAAPAELLMAPGYDPSFGASFKAFIKSIMESTPASPDLRNGLRALHLVTTAEAAAAQGTIAPVQLS